MWRGNSRQTAIWYDEEDKAFKNGVGNKISPIGIMNKPNVANKVSGHILNEYMHSLEFEREFERKLKVHRE